MPNAEPALPVLVIDDDGCATAAIQAIPAPRKGEMQIGPRTCESHRAWIMREFNAGNAAELVRMALRARAVSGDGQSGPAFQT
jgi:hypothetical protein